MNKKEPTGRGKCILKEVCTPSGRPRSEASRIALLETAYSLMIEHPVHAISTQQIASNAGVSTATVYRWWSTKEALLLDAVVHNIEQRRPMREEGSPLERLRGHVLEVGRLMEGKQGRVCARLLAAIQDDEVLRKAFIEKLYLPQLNKVITVVQEAIDRGDLPPETDPQLLMDTVFGTIFTRLMVRHEIVKRADVERGFDFAIAGAMELFSKTGKVKSRKG